MENELNKIIKELSTKYQFTELQEKKLKKYFNTIKVNDYIYPSILKSKSLIDIKTIYNILNELEKEGFLINIYELYCTKCNTSKGVFKSLRDIDTIYCECCDEKLTLEDVYVIYKMQCEQKNKEE